MNKQYLIRRKSDGMYFGWVHAWHNDAHDHPHWYVSPSHEDTNKWLVARFDSEEKAVAGIQTVPYLKQFENDLEVVEYVVVVDTTTAVVWPVPETKKTALKEYVVYFSKSLPGLSGWLDDSKEDPVCFGQTIDHAETFATREAAEAAAEERIVEAYRRFNIASVGLYAGDKPITDDIRKQYKYFVLLKCREG